MKDELELWRCVAGSGRELSAYGARRIAALVRTVKSPDSLRTRVDSLPTQQERKLAGALAERWSSFPEQPADAVASGLIAAQLAADAERRSLTVQLAWTGPKSRKVAVARTDEALYRVVEAAKQRLLVVSYATWQVPKLVELLGHAVDRGVEVDMVLEFYGSEEGGSSWDAIGGLGGSFPEGISVYHWPPENRPKTANSKMGYLHAKCAVADGKKAFVSSANLTAYAMEMNMELGVLIEGGMVPSQIAEHFQSLIVDGVLQEWKPDE
jgi:phosphatidylserine/phosphatidylglycerophosphate/cardiolipin synthase-like enzyme